MISFLLDFLGSLLPSMLLVVLGYFITLQFTKKLGCNSLLDKYFIALVSGTALIIIPTLFWILIIDSSLSQFFVVYTSIVVCVCIYSFIRHSDVVKNDFYRVCWIAKHMINGDIFEQFAFISVIVFTSKIIYYLSIVPINVDALYSYLPSALYFVRFGQVYPYADPPVAPLLYASTYSITGGFVNEPFRQIPLFYILCAPLLVFAISRRFLTRRYALIALILCAFSPFSDTGTYLWPWHTDFIAGAFAGLAIFFVIKRFKYHEAFAGLSLSLSILTKTAFGLATAIIVLMLFLNNLKKKLLSVISFFGILLFLLLFGLKYSFSIISFMSPLNLALLAGFVIILVLTLSFIRSRTFSTTNIWVFVLTLFPVIIWTGRQVILGGTPLALPIFPSQVPDTSWWQSFTTQIAQTSHLSWNIGGIFLIFYHPLLGLSMFATLLVGLLYTLKEKKTNTLFLITFLYYFIWFSAFSPGASFRHLYPALFFLYPIIALGFYKIISLFRIQSSLKVVLMLLFFTLLQSTQNMGVHLAYSYLTDSPLRWVLSNIVNEPPWLSYENPSQILPFIWVLVCSFILCCLFPILLRKIKVSSKTSFHRVHFKKLTTLLMFVLYSSSIMIAPLTYSAMISSAGDLSSYSMSGSWYNYQIHISNDLKGVVQKGRILTFHFDSFYYLALNNLTYYDSWHGHITSFPLGSIHDYSYLREAIEANGLFTLKKALYDYFGVRYILIPTPSYYGYELFSRFNNFSKMFDILDEGNALKFIKNYDYFDLYALSFEKVVNSKKLLMKIDFSNSTNKFVPTYGDWQNVNGTYCGSRKGDFGFSLIDLNLTDFEVEVKVKAHEDVRDVGITFRSEDPKNRYVLLIDSYHVVIMKMQNGVPTYPYHHNLRTLSNQWFTLKLVAIGNTFKVYIDGKLLLRVVDADPYPSGKVGLALFDETACFDDFALYQLQVGSL